MFREFFFFFCYCYWIENGNQWWEEEIDKDDICTQIESIEWNHARLRLMSSKWIMIDDFRFAYLIRKWEDRDFFLENSPTNNQTESEKKGKKTFLFLPLGFQSTRLFLWQTHVFNSQLIIRNRNISNNCVLF